MSKSKRQAASAAQRREQQRKQRQQRLEGGQNIQASGRSPASQARSRTVRKSQRNQWFMVGGVLILVAAIIVAFAVISRLQAGNAAAPTPVGSTVLKEVTQVDPNILAQVGTGGLQNPLHAVQGSPPLLTGPTGKPEFLYIGAEYCPFCAAQRWPMVVALSRFGTFSKLYQTTSSSTDVYPNTPTFTFYQNLYNGSFYTSQYIDFVAVETLGNQPDSSGSYPTLQTPTAQQQQLLNTYDAPPYTTQAGSIPFIDIGNKYVTIGAAPGYSPQNLANQQVQEIANTLSDTSSSLAKEILGTANYLTAGICTITQQQPASVCSTDTIQKIEQSLGKTAVGASGTTEIAIAADFEAVVRRDIV